MSSSLDDLPDDPAALKAIIATERAEAQRMAASVRAYELLVQALKLRIARLQRQKFGPSSERIGREVEQLQLALEDLEVAASAADATSEPKPAEAAASGLPRAVVASRAWPRRSRASGWCSTLAIAARIAAVLCAWWGRTWPSSSSLSPPS
jgi:transposase